MSRKSWSNPIISGTIFCSSASNSASKSIKQSAPFCLFLQETALSTSALRASSDGGGASDETAVTDVALTLFVKENDGATNSWDDCVTTELEDLGGTGGGEGCKGSIVASGADDDVATVTEEESAATVVADGVVPAELRDVVDAGDGGDARPPRSA